MGDFSQSSEKTIICSLCESGDQEFFATRPERGDFLLCPLCGLIHLKPEFRLEASAEKERYLEHNNDPEDEGYRSFLKRLADPLVELLNPGDQGLDFGAGPGPALAMILEGEGFPTAIYDPFFHPETAVLEKQYDFVTCTEVAEHFYSPREEFQRLNRLLKPGAWLGVMTEFAFSPPDPDRFKTWYYARDPAHVCFYQEKTFVWLAERYDYKLLIPRKNVALLQKASEVEKV